MPTAVQMARISKKGIGEQQVAHGDTRRLAHGPIRTQSVHMVIGRIQPVTRALRQNLQQIIGGRLALSGQRIPPHRQVGLLFIEALLARPVQCAAGHPRSGLFQQTLDFLVQWDGGRCHGGCGRRFQRHYTGRTTASQQAEGQQEQAYVVSWSGDHKRGTDCCVYQQYTPSIGCRSAQQAANQCIMYQRLMR